MFKRAYVKQASGLDAGRRRKPLNLCERCLAKVVSVRRLITNTRSRAGMPSPYISMMGELRSTTTLRNGPFVRLLLEEKNCLFAGADCGGEWAAVIYSLFDTAKLEDIDPGLHASFVLCFLNITE
jgi:hypothetical protein